jgi:hypothetical protein
MDGRALALGSMAVLAALSVRKGSFNSDKLVLHYDEYWKPNQDGYFQALREQGATLHEIANIILGHPGATMTAAILTASQYAYWLSGQQVFVVGPKLQHLFALTALNKVPEWAIKFPYDAYYLALPDCPWKIRDPHTGWHQVGGAYVRVLDESEYPSDYPNRGPVISMVVWGMPNENSKFKGDDAVSYAQLDIGEAYDDYGSLESYFEHKAGKRGDEMVGGPVPMRMVAGADPWKTEPDHREAVRNVLRVIINSAIYMNTSAALFEGDDEYSRQNAARRRIEDEIVSLSRSGKKGRQVKRGTEKLRKKKRNFSGASVIWIGRGEQEGEPKVSSSSRSSGRKMRRHWVRGHWKFPARKHGERKAVWIKPFQRGSYDPESSKKHRKYKLGDK